jgi:hypothetical protein
MPRSVELTRDEAERLVDLLEDCDLKVVGTWRHAIAEDIREAFGMITLDEERRLLAQLDKK